MEINLNIYKFIGVIIILLLIIGFFIYRFVCLFYSKTEAFDYSPILLSQLSKNGELKTGDLILFSNICKDMIVQFYNMSLYTHCGMVIIIGKIPYILEINADNKKRILDNLGHDAKLNEFNARVQNYKGNVYLLKLNKKISAEMQIKLIEIIRGKKFKYINNTIDKIKSLFSNSNKYFHCYGFINYLLTEMEIMEKKSFFDASLYICDISNKELINGFKYNSPLHIVQDMITLD